MPCESDWMHDDAAEKAKWDNLTRLLCATCRLLESRGELKKITPAIPGLWDWWQEHKRQDAEREAREAERLREETAKDVAEFIRLREKLGYP